jgi:pyruvate dehydrogenase E1 component alpha subunit
MAQAETMTRKDPAPRPAARGEGGGIDGFTREELHDFLREMLLYRRFEEKAEEAYAIGKIGGFCHLHIGQEAVALGFIGPLRTDDYVISAYREHTQALAKGVSPRGVMAELYGRRDGSSGGKGGSMHIIDTSVNFMGGHGIVGAQVATATGLAYAAKYRNEDRVTVCFLGDAAVNQGAFHESLNLAAIWNLPVIYVVENNSYGMGTAFSRVSTTPMVDKSASHGIPAHSINGQDILETWTFTRDLVARVREGAGPQFVDARTYRFKGHSMSDPVSGTYRSKDEVQAKIDSEDPIGILRDRLFQAELLTESELKAIDAGVKEVVDDAAEFADASPLPDPSELVTDVYSEINEHGRLFMDGRDREV